MKDYECVSVLLCKGNKKPNTSDIRFKFFRKVADNNFYGC